MKVSPKGHSDSFSYNGLDTRVGKVDSSGSHVYRRDGVGVTDPLLNDGSAEYTPGISRTAGSSTLFYGSDRMGSNVMQTDSSQNISSTSQFDAFGNLISSTGSPQGPLGFNGQYGYQSDSDTGFQLLGHRYYDPSTGRFLSRDPAKDGQNWYDYCANNPLMFCDPLGLWLGKLVHGIIAGVAAAGVAAGCFLAATTAPIWGLILLLVSAGVLTWDFIDSLRQAGNAADSFNKIAQKIRQAYHEHKISKIQELQYLEDLYHSKYYRKVLRKIKKAAKHGASDANGLDGSQW